MSEQQARVPDLLLERYRLGEMSPAQQEMMERRLASDPEARRRFDELARSDREIRRRHPPAWLASQVRARLAAHAFGASDRRSGSLRHWSWPAALVSTAVVVIAVVHLTGRVPDPEARGESAGAARAPVDRIKGLAPSLVLYRKTAEGSETLEDGARARKGDVVRLAYRAAGRGYGTIVSIDGRGTVTQHLPQTGGRAVPLRSGQTVLLDHAYELDDAPRFERFYLVSSEAPFDISPVLSAARRAAASAAEAPPALELPESLEQASLSLRKEETR